MNHRGKNGKNHEYQDSNDSASTPESNSITRLPRKLQLPASMHFFFVLTPPSPSTLQHFLFQIFFNFSRLPFSFELTKKPLLSLDLVATPTVAILKDCVTNVAMLCAVEMSSTIQGNDVQLRQFFCMRPTS